MSTIKITKREEFEDDVSQGAKYTIKRERPTGWIHLATEVLCGLTPDDLKMMELI